jgi:hypothetical protein
MTGKKNFFIFHFFAKTKNWNSFQPKIRLSCKKRPPRPHGRRIEGPIAKLIFTLKFYWEIFEKFLKKGFLKIF